MQILGSLYTERVAPSGSRQPLTCGAGCPFGDKLLRVIFSLFVI